jgi:cell division protein ZapA
MKQIEVQIMGQGYLLSCPEGGEAMMLQAVSRVDAAMCKIRDAGKVKARDRIAVLASLNLAFELSEAIAKAQSIATAPVVTRSPASPHPVAKPMC